MRRPTPAVIATGGLHAVAAPAISGAAQRPGKALSRRVTALLTSKERLVGCAAQAYFRAAFSASLKTNGSGWFSKDSAASLRASTAAARIRLPQRTGKR